MRPGKEDFIVGRHQEAEYKLNKGVLYSEHPQDAVEAINQDFATDLTEKGRTEAEKEAKEFFTHFNTARDAFFFASSDFVRAIETTNIYRKEAEQEGFDIISPEKPGSEIVAKVGEGHIKHLNTLSLKIENGLVDQLFSPKTDYLEEAVKRGVQFEPELIMRWREARKIVEENNRNNWSDNWRDFSTEVKKILPEVQTAQESFEVQFKNMLRLIEVGRKKIEQADYDKKIRVVAFTHENLFTHWLGEYWNEPGMKLGETVSFYYDPEKKLHGVVRGKDQTLDL